MTKQTSKIVCAAIYIISTTPCLGSEEDNEGAFTTPKKTNSEAWCQEYCSRDQFGDYTGGGNWSDHRNIDPIDTLLMHHDMVRRPFLDEKHLFDCKEHCHTKMMFYRTLLQGNRLLPFKDSLEKDEEYVPLATFCNIVSQMIDDQVLCRLEQEEAKHILGQVQWDYLSERNMWSERYTFFANYHSDSLKWTEEAPSLDILTQLSTSLRKRLSLWTTIINNFSEFYKKYNTQYNEVLSQPLIPQLTQQRSITNDASYRACALSGSIKTLNNFIDNIGKIKPVLLMLCTSDENRLANTKYLLDYYEQSLRNSMLKSINTLDVVNSDLQKLREAYKKQSLCFPMLENHGGIEESTAPKKSSDSPNKFEDSSSLSGSLPDLLAHTEISSTETSSSSTSPPTGRKTKSFFSLKTSKVPPQGIPMVRQSDSKNKDKKHVTPTIH